MHEADTRTVVDAVDQQVGQLFDLGVVDGLQSPDGRFWRGAQLISL
jgi:hypothetical protein